MDQFVIVRCFANWHPVVGRCRDRHSQWVRPGRTVWLFGLPVTRNSQAIHADRMPGSARLLDPGAQPMNHLKGNYSCHGIHRQMQRQSLAHNRYRDLTAPGSSSRSRVAGLPTLMRIDRERTDVIQQTIRAERSRRHLITLGIWPTPFVCIRLLDKARAIAGTSRKPRAVSRA